MKKKMYQILTTSTATSITTYMHVCMDGLACHRIFVATVNQFLHSNSTFENFLHHIYLYVNAHKHMVPVNSIERLFTAWLITVIRLLIGMYPNMNLQ